MSGWESAGFIALGAVICLFGMLMAVWLIDRERGR